MHFTLLEYLVCPNCKNELSLRAHSKTKTEVITGTLDCSLCNKKYPIHKSIPRFVTLSNYANSFSFQWNKFRQIQLDSYNNTSLSRQRFLNETKLKPQWIKGKRILDAGCGPGRFSEIALSYGATVFSVDISTAIEACSENFTKNPDIHFIQADLNHLPFRKKSFDALYCIGVIQHTPTPQKLIKTLPSYVKENGKVAMTIYWKKRFTALNMKYLIRPLTKRLPQKVLFKLVKYSLPFLFPITNVLFRLPWLKKFFKHLIPVANYVDEKQLTMQERYKWAILDTFDMLSPYYDYPQKKHNIASWLLSAGVKNVYIDSSAQSVTGTIEASSNMDIHTDGEVHAN